MFRLESGNYDLIGDGEVLKSFPKNGSELVYFSFRGSKVRLNYKGSNLGGFEKVELAAKDEAAKFRIRIEEDERVYSGSISLFENEGKLLAVNQVDLEMYVAGVVESEGEPEPNQAYLRAQAVIARTYAYRMRKSIRLAPFDLCDSPQCQVYNSSAYGKNGYDVYKAVFSTRGLILVDSKNKPITAAFHANSGGITANSEDVWSSPVPYLKGKIDSFSLKGRSATWERNIPIEEWLEFVKKSSPGIVSDSAAMKRVLEFENPYREKHLNAAGVLIPYTDIRREFGLRSAFFDGVQDGPSIKLRGRGYGHGVGLSQDGALEMARTGYAYHEILYFYYSDVQLVSVNQLD